MKQKEDMYISFISKSDDGLLKLRKKKIDNEYIDVLNQLRTMLDNPNRTVLDMQECFVRVIRERRFLPYCWPYSYYASHISGIGYPKLYQFIEYKDKLQTQRESVSKRCQGRIAIEMEMKAYVKRLKSTFMETCVRYIPCLNIANAVSEISNDPQNVMWSSEEIGWTTYEYKVNEDVLITVSTNFGYGNSSYFLLGLKYKDIDILPYSALIHYYGVDAVELKRHTRQYCPDRGSWDMALDFVVETANLAYQDPEKFVKKFIINEVDEMIAGLKHIMQYPNMEIQRLIRKKGNKVNSGFWSVVYNMTDSQCARYKIFASEMDVVYKSEKITGALYFLDNLSSLVEIFPAIQDAMDVIKSLNNELLPEIEKNIISINEMIRSHKQNVERLNGELALLKDQIKVHDKAIDELVEGVTDYSQRCSIRKDYESQHPEYSKLCSERDTIDDKISELNSFVFSRTDFVDSLERCKSRIQEYLSVA